MKKIRRKWFRPDTVAPVNRTFTDFTVFSEKFSSAEPMVPVIEKKSLKDELWEEIRQFKAEGLYTEALSCFHTVFEKKYTDNYTFYELADIYFLMEDYTRSLNWLQKFQLAQPENGRGFLLRARIYIRQGKKEEALSVINQLFSRKIKIDGEKEYRILDRIIERLKKIFKADKLSRRCPDIIAYQKKRRYTLKNTRHTDNPPVKIERTIMSTQNISVNSQLSAALNRIWDMQSANQEDMQKVLASSAEEIGSAVMKQVLSYKKKIWLFNYLADTFRKHDNINSALFLLRQALLLDDENDTILKNLGYLLCQNGEYKAALAALEDVSDKDFAVSDLIRKCRNLESE